MAEKKNIHDGKKLRYYRPAKLYVDPEGSYVEDIYDGELEIKTNPDGSAYVVVLRHSRKVKIYLSWIVCTAYNKKPKDGNPYIVVHKDGDLKNCNKDNLVWGLGIENPALTDEVQMSEDLFVRKDGIVIHDGEQLEMVGNGYDADLDLLYCYGESKLVMPVKGSLYSRTMNLNLIMQNAGFVKLDPIGEDNGLGIIHINNDPTDFNSTNLLAVPLSDQRYIDYQKVIADYKHKKNTELNPGIKLPKGW